MSDGNKHNLLYFESASTSIQRDGENYCCVALTNPTEVVITSADGKCTRAVIAAATSTTISAR